MAGRTANLTRKGKGRPRGSQNKATVDVRALAQGLVDDLEYRKRLKDRLLSGKMAPALETLLWHYAYGKPRDTLDITAPEGLDFTLKLDGG